MTDMSKAIPVIDKKLREYGVYADVTQYSTLPVVIVSINRGDWKHEHWCAKEALSDLGAMFLKTEVTWEDGSDSYSADHYFIVNGSDMGQWYDKLSTASL